MTTTRVAFAVVIERGDASYGAYIPDLPGCVAVAETEDEVRRLIKEAAEAHIEIMREHGEPIPEPRSRTSEVLVEVPG